MTLIPDPEQIRRRLDEIDRERRDLRQLMRLAERHHGEPPSAARCVKCDTVLRGARCHLCGYENAGEARPDPMKLETK